MLAPENFGDSLYSALRSAVVLWREPKNISSYHVFPRYAPWKFLSYKVFDILWNAFFSFALLVIGHVRTLVETIICVCVQAVLDVKKHCIQYMFPKTRGFVHIYTDGSVDLNHCRGRAAGYIPLFAVKCVGQLNFQSSSWNRRVQCHLCCALDSRYALENTLMMSPAWPLPSR